MKKKSQLLLAISITFTVFAFSCKKNKDANPVISTQAKITGKWIMIESIEDFDQNNKIDADDYHTQVGGYSLLHLYDNGMAVKMVTAYDSSLSRWSLVSNNEYVQLSDTDYNGSYSAPIIQHIDSLTSSRLVLRDTTYLWHRWFVYARYVPPPPPSATAAKFLGKWWATNYVLDTNHNGISDNADYKVDTLMKVGMFGIAVYDHYQGFTFNPNGTVRQTIIDWRPDHSHVETRTYDLTWSLTNNDADIVISGKVSHIEDLNTSGIEFKDTCSGCFKYNSSTQWMFYSRY